MKLSYTLLFTVVLTAQLFSQEQIFDAYDEHFNDPREVVYVHLNKTEFAKNEMIGFKAYVFDKGSKQLSKSTRNLYCTITDLENNTLKEKMLLVENGVVSNTFVLDSLFDSGDYLFKAYTNWMRNFDEPNYFVSKIKITDVDNPPNDNQSKSAVVEPDVQVLPEGGHLLNDVTSALGIIAKDQFGKGLSNAEAVVVNSKNDTISKLQLNQFGIGKTIIKTEEGEQYKVLVKYGYSFYEAKVPEAKTIGVSLNVTDTKEDVFLTVSTNSKSLKILRQKPLTLAIHNGSQIATKTLAFDEKKLIKVQLNKDALYKGLNIFTLFNEKNQPILERLYFNHTESLNSQISYSGLQKREDSIKVRFKLKDYKSDQNSSLSVSLLPYETKAYKPNGNIISKTHLEPYIKGQVENLAYYFTDIDAKKKFELDNLLITQGWSSYSWNSIFSTPSMTTYAFEQGINVSASVNQRKANQFLIQPLSKSKAILVGLPDDENTFEAKGMYPVDNEKLTISGVTDEGKVVKPGVYARFEPNKVPALDVNLEKDVIYESPTLLYDTKDAVFALDKGVQELSEVELIVKKEQTRREKIEKNAFGRVYHVDKPLRDSNISFANWLASKGYIVVEDVTQDPNLQIRLARRNSFSGSTVPLIMFDGVPLRGSSINILYQFSMANIEYVDIDRRGLSAPFGGGSNFGGVIRIKTNSEIFVEGFKFDSMFVKDFDLTFSSPKRYYVPKYQNTRSSFFRNYGVVGWEPNATISPDGIVELTIKDPLIDAVKFYVEGITNGNEFLSKQGTIQLD